MQPCPGDRPFALHRRWRKTHRGGSLVDRQAAEEPHLDDFHLPFVEGSKGPEGVVECDELVFTVLITDGDGRFERDEVNAAAPLFGPFCARMVDEDPPHHLRRHSDELGAVLPLDPALADEPDECFMDERRRLERVFRTLLAEVGAGEAALLAVHDRDQFVERGGIALSPSDEEGRHASGIGHFPHCKQNERFVIRSRSRRRCIRRPARRPGPSGIVNCGVCPAITRL